MDNTSREGFTNEYIKVLTKYDSKNVYELWKSQLDALRCNNKGFNYLSENIKKYLFLCLQVQEKFCCRIGDSKVTTVSGR